MYVYVQPYMHTYVYLEWIDTHLALRCNATIVAVAGILSLGPKAILWYFLFRRNEIREKLKSNT